MGKMGKMGKKLNYAKLSFLFAHGGRGSGQLGHVTARPGGSGKKRGSCRWVTLSDGRKLCIGGSTGSKVIKEKNSDGKVESKLKSKSAQPGGSGSRSGGGGSSTSGTSPKTWDSRLTDKEREALTIYTTERFISINSGLRNGNLSAKDKAVVKDIDSALNKSITEGKNTLYEHQRLYRATDNPIVNIAVSQAIKDGKHIGFTFTEKGFTSTTLDKKVADNYLRGNTPRMFVIHVKPGTKAGDISKYSSYAKEKEVLIARDTKYKITGVEKVKEKYDVRVLGGKVVKKTREVEYFHMEVISQ